MTCKALEGGLFLEPCHGLNLYSPEREIIIDKDSCYNECYKIYYRRKMVFADGSFISYDDLLICGDKEFLKYLSQKLKEFVGD